MLNNKANGIITAIKLSNAIEIAHSPLLPKENYSVSDTHLHASWLSDESESKEYVEVNIPLKNLNDAEIGSNGEISIQDEFDSTVSLFLYTTSLIRV
ncbi:hypothetical protein [Vibrio alginolyticus]|uniref:hypothetical protein n=1 Tax=Vibrio TaxID=662 RepID=UPI0006CA6A3D|nr:hypothetical protein [Vibrio alginolyticus]KPM98465.1 hypothetical protein AOG25_08450 [Vibrio alginolyticus]CAH7232751.1 conserved hypothetical protein [Vibrio chagasii]